MCQLSTHVPVLSPKFSMTCRIGRPHESKSLEGRRSVRSHRASHSWKQLSVPDRESRESGDASKKPAPQIVVTIGVAHVLSLVPAASSCQLSGRIFSKYILIKQIFMEGSSTPKEFTCHWVLLWPLGQAVSKADPIPGLPGDGGILTTRHDPLLPIPAVIGLPWGLSFTSPHWGSLLSRQEALRGLCHRLSFSFCPFLTSVKE